MDCPRCASAQNVKSGILRGRQRYLCKNCGYQHSVEKRSCDATKETKETAVRLYLEGMGLRAIGRILGYSNVSVLNWVRKFAQTQTLIAAEESIPVIEIDEMHTYIGSKKSRLGVDRR